MRLSKNESITYIGGAGLTASLVAAVTSFLKTLYSFGQNLGSSVKSLVKGC